MLSRPLQLVLLITAGLVGYTWWQEKQHDEAAAELETPARRAPKRAEAPPRAASAASAASAAAIQKGSPVASAASAVVNLFPRQTWAPPPTPTPVPPPPPPPSAPPLPFVMAASWHENGIDQFIVEAQGQQFVLCEQCNSVGRIRPGDTVLGVYRLDRVSRDLIVFTYLPLNQQQQLPTGGTP
ncbi:hypothetical protein [Chitinilyticum litopenaei]|uniref:hypothetical protein n=1 Tax=Chitinilyticum litopenaei TaxID=1121276 RepID=UPI00042213F0|nr:hypothetical protein [Chitinilyticum litopenaei]